MPIAERITLTDLVRSRLERVQKLVPAVLVGEDAEDVHDLRVATRRLQQALVARCDGERTQALRAVRRRLRRLRRTLGEWRNHDVLLGIVLARRRRARSEPRRRLLAILDGDLAERRRREVKRARKAVLRLDLGTLGSEVAALTGDLPESDGASLAKSIVEGWEAWQTALAHAAETPTTEAVHALRIAGKRLRYRIELTLELGDDGWKTTLSWLKRLQERLGDWHDRQMLYAAMARALSRPEVFLESSSAVRAALAAIESDRRHDAEELDELFRRASDPPPLPAVETVAT